MVAPAADDAALLKRLARGEAFAFRSVVVSATAGTTRGWSFAAFEELWNYGFPQEFEHFVDCVANDKEPMETGEDGRAVLEIILAAYASAGQGKKIALPFGEKETKPIRLWKPNV